MDIRTVELRPEVLKAYDACRAPGAFDVLVTGEAGCSKTLLCQLLMVDAVRVLSERGRSPFGFLPDEVHVLAYVAPTQVEAERSLRAVSDACAGYLTRLGDVRIELKAFTARDHYRMRGLNIVHVVFDDVWSLSDEFLSAFRHRVVSRTAEAYPARVVRAVDTTPGVRTQNKKTHAAL